VCLIAPLIRSVDIFRSLTDRELSRLADVAEAVSMPAQTIIIRQGDEADAMYVLMAS
jgi:CRP-like cAMP-binding protein